MRVLIDTCVWTRFLRRGRPADDPVAGEVGRLIRSDAVQMLGCIRQELLSGVRPHDRFEQLKDYLRFYPNLPLDAEDDENAASGYNLCRDKGIHGASVDLLICAVAVRHGLRIFTTDKDFEHYAHWLPIQMHRTSRGRNRLSE
jgi:predicted nucleic acid-binding protein